MQRKRLVILAVAIVVGLGLSIYTVRAPSEVVQPTRQPSVAEEPTPPAEVLEPSPADPPLVETPAPTPANEQVSFSLQRAFAEAAEEFGVPLPVLMSVSYNFSRWEQHNGESSTTGGYGLMHLPGDLPRTRRDSMGPALKTVPAPPTAVPNVSGAPVVTPVLQDPERPSLGKAARLLKLHPWTLQSSPRHNVRAGAALLAEYARFTTGELPADPGRWYGAVAKFGGSLDATVAHDFADVVYATIQQGVARTTSAGELVVLLARDITPDKSTVAALNLQPTDPAGADCPPDLPCRWTPALYHYDTSVGDYGNYDLANRPDDGVSIDYIVIHDAELPYHKTVGYFQQPWAHVSTHYVIRGFDGLVTQQVDNKDIAWTAGNKYMNTHSINIEHEGYAVEGASWYSEQMYRASSRLVRHLADKYGIPLDRGHIIGHSDVPGVSPGRQSEMHWDPGPFWDWAHYMELLGAPLEPRSGPNSGQIVTIKPSFTTHKPVVRSCFLNGCRNLPEQPASFIYLYREPSFDAPLLDDPAVKGDGTQLIHDWGDKASTGQEFARADVQGDWEAIWYGGQKAWFHNPGGINTVPGEGMLVTPRAGLGSIPVYGRPAPESLSSLILEPLQYSVEEGQAYVATDLITGDEYDGGYLVAQGALTLGQEQFYSIHFNHRLGYLRAADVDLIDGSTQTAEAP